jgi:hypothetical protein
MVSLIDMGLGMILGMALSPVMMKLIVVLTDMGYNFIY